MVSGSSDVSLTMIDVQSPFQEASPMSSMGSIWSDGSVFDFVLDLDSVSASGHAPHPLVDLVPQVSDSVLSSRLVSGSAMLV
jgi:hypothetical protein